MEENLKMLEILSVLKFKFQKLLSQNPYHTRNMEKANAAKVHLEKLSFEEN